MACALLAPRFFFIIIHLSLAMLWVHLGSFESSNSLTAPKGSNPLFRQLCILFSRTLLFCVNAVVTTVLVHLLVFLNVLTPR